MEELIRILDFLEEAAKVLKKDKLKWMSREKFIDCMIEDIQYVKKELIKKEGKKNENL